MKTRSDQSIPRDAIHYDGCDPLELAALGLRIFPAHNPTPDGGCSCRRPGCDDIAKHPRIAGWQDGATTDEMTIRRWRKQYPFANWLVALDEEDMILDNDPRNGGEESLARLQREIGPLPITWRTLTGGGGEHYWLRVPRGSGIKSGPLEGYPGLDIKAARSLVIAPGSLHASGKRYAWDVGAHPGDLPRADAPAALVALARRPAPSPKAASGTSSDPEAPITAMRNNTLTSIAGKLRAAGLSQAAIEAALVVTNAERCQPPLEDDEVGSIARSVARYPAGQLPPPPPDIAAVQAQADANRSLQSATVRAMGHARARKYVPVAARLAAELIRRKIDGVAPDTDDGLYYISKAAIGGKTYGKDEWQIKEGTVRNHLKDLRDYAPHIPGFRSGLRPIDFPTDVYDSETGARVMRREDTWCFAFDGNPADIVDVLPTLPYPEDGRGKARCPSCRSKRLDPIKWRCRDCDETTEHPVYEEEEEDGVNFTPTPPDADATPEAECSAFTPIGEGATGTGPATPGGKVYPPLSDPAAEEVAEGFRSLYERARAQPPPTPPPFIPCAGCPEVELCSGLGHCAWQVKL